ncbi:YhdH/YhfP family quinone oxidoreductase [Polaribacter undariae]|uniref:YhdH/YhfP family quinone oxidoreductase n=1 Tax=Polaribacter sejongensis TaxID=985043 RepID=A0AAJ1VF50_9FLAO|nr:YhdH/YhfP family quinone oxidoreductase [Polaribacter undariae]MDN3618014.1 YhdH/YhfP family quinone oxidoreductase [Polaribacter undariae]UWD31954.1 YhdH/YhfP family quinone oxidoreductase [Polaribacter undariae]
MDNQSNYKAFRVEEKDGNFISSVKEIAFTPLEQGEVLIKVHYSSLNYKDALSSSGNKGVTRNYPHTPGIDAAGTVVSSESTKFKISDNVIVTSYDLGMNTDGGFAEYVKVPEDWVVKLPENLSMKEAMTIGTAGLTAGMSVLKLTTLVKPEDGAIVVSGATGGVGSTSIAILKTLGYKTIAITGKESEIDFLKKLGADEIMMRKDVEEMAKRPLLKPLFAGGIDTVGGVILENIIKATAPMGVITCCGNVASPKLELTVFPFILRGITLIGIDSQNYPMTYREKVWNKLANEWKNDDLTEASAEISLDELSDKIDLMLQGRLKGRTLVNLDL